MLHKLIILFFASSSCIASAQIYECKDQKGARLWTNQPCADGKVLHQGVGTEAQLRAEEADRAQRVQRARTDAAAAQRFRQNAYSGNTTSGRISSKNIENCNSTRRSLRIERSKTYSNQSQERISQLSADERKYC